MVCEQTRKAGQTPEQRKKEVDEALRRLERQLAERSAKVVVGANGALAIAGWRDNAGLTDACAYRTLTARGSFEMRVAVQRAEALAGRAVVAAVVGSGLHSHDGGKTWHPGH